jgi:hypothetical protein
MSKIRPPRLSCLWIAVAVLAAATMPGCGSTRQHGGSTNASASGIRFSRCMRSNGVPNFPDPGPGGYQLDRLGINQQSPAYQSAFNTCEKDLPPSEPSPPVPASVRRQELALANCMRAHGVPNFPDPNANGDIQFPVTSPIPRSPAFQRAQSGPCRNYLSR